MIECSITGKQATHRYINALGETSYVNLDAIERELPEAWKRLKRELDGLRGLAALDALPKV